jgi:multiple sugar transport system permease protein
VQSTLQTKVSGLYGLDGRHTIFVGLSNYSQALRSEDFVASVGRVLLFGVVEVPIMVVLATGLALLMDAASARLSGLFRVSFFLPYGVPGVIASILWGFLYVPGISPISKALGVLGLHVDLLSPSVVLWSIANIVTWQAAGYNVLIMNAQLRSISGDVIEAGRIDGASGWQLAWRIKLPLIRPAIVLAAVFSIIGVLQLFGEPLILKPITSSISSTYTPNMTSFTQTFSNNDPGLGAAESVLLALVICALSLAFLRLVNGRSGR